MADFTDDEIDAELARRNAESPANTKAAPTSADFNSVMKSEGLNQTPFSVLRNVAVGGGEAAQSFGDFVMRKLGYNTPHLDIAKTLGAGDTMTDKALQSVGQYGVAPVALGGVAAPLGAAGEALEGLGAGGKVAANVLSRGAPQAAFGATQTQNPAAGLAAGFGGQALAEAAPIAAPYVKPLAQKAGQAIMKGINYLRPDEDAATFLQRLGSGTKEENAQALAQDIQDSHQAKLQDALQHKTPVYAQEGNSDIYKMPESALPEGNLEKVAHYIAPGQQYTGDQMTQLAKEIKNFRAGKANGEPYDFDDFAHEVQSIFKSDMTPVQMKNLETALDVPAEMNQNFLNLADKNPKLFEGKTSDLFNTFKNDPSLNNADKLQSEIGAQIGNLRDEQIKQGKSSAIDYKIEKLKNLRDTLKDDMQSHLNRVDPTLAAENTKFVNKYRENVAPYEEEQTIRGIVNEPQYTRNARAANPEQKPLPLKSSQINGLFANPSISALQIANDIGEAGQKKILYNELADNLRPSATKLGENIISARQNSGLARYMTPEMEDFAKELIKRSKYRNAANVVGKGLGYTALGGAGYEAIKHTF